MDDKVRLIDAEALKNYMCSTCPNKERREDTEQITKPKTEHSHRQIPIPKHIISLLESDRDRYIIGNSTKPTEPRTLQYQWKRFCKEQGMRDINFHTLRHTFATSALEAGIDIKTLSEMLGHASTSITMDLYCHPTLKHKKDCMDKLWGGKP